MHNYDDDDDKSNDWKRKAIFNPCSAAGKEAEKDHKISSLSAIYYRKNILFQWDVLNFSALSAGLRIR